MSGRSVQGDRVDVFPLRGLYAGREMEIRFALYSPVGGVWLNQSPAVAVNGKAPMPVELYDDHGGYRFRTAVPEPGDIPVHLEWIGGSRNERHSIDFTLPVWKLVKPSDEMPPRELSEFFLERMGEGGNTGHPLRSLGSPPPGAPPEESPLLAYAIMGTGAVVFGIGAWMVGRGARQPKQEPGPQANEDTASLEDDQQ